MQTDLRTHACLHATAETHILKSALTHPKVQSLISLGAPCCFLSNSSILRICTNQTQHQIVSPILPPGCYSTFPISPLGTITQTQTGWLLTGTNALMALSYILGTLVSVGYLPHTPWAGGGRGGRWEESTVFWVSHTTQLTCLEKCLNHSFLSILEHLFFSSTVTQAEITSLKSFTPTVKLPQVVLLQLYC